MNTAQLLEIYLNLLKEEGYAIMKNYDEFKYNLYRILSAMQLTLEMQSTLDTFREKMKETKNKK
ncbi:hypothetical protein FACS1894130_06980 [Spirochaetia bacterium]|nr:hypothetical protein FACS1894130_06980 [Spirochaetia bacterium]